MDARTQAKYEARSSILKAIAHSTRLFIVEQLSVKERCVCELQEMIEADISTVSRHLAVLKNAGIVQSEKRGVQVYYKLRCPCILEFLNCIETVIKDTAREQLELMK